MKENIYECTVGDQTIRLHLDTDEEPEEGRNHELWRARTYETKEPDTLEWIRDFIRAGDVLYDVGANIGQYSLYAAVRLNGDIDVRAFEPEALNFAKLNRNIVLNGLRGSVTAYPLAIGERTGLNTFFVNSFSTGAALHSLGQPMTQGDVPFEAQNEQGIMSVSLDDLVYTFGAPVPTHIKIDVDGIEALIVTGALRLLRDPRLETVLIEVYMYKDIASAVRSEFEAAGMELHNADSLDYTPGTVRNLIFVRS